MNNLTESAFFILLLAGIAAGVRRQLILYESETSNEIFYNFTSAVPDVHVFPWIKRIERLCYLGLWHCHKDPGFHGYNHPMPWEYSQFSDSTFKCRNMSSIWDWDFRRSVPKNKSQGFDELCSSFRPAGGGLDMSLTTLTLFNDTEYNGRDMTLTVKTGGIRTLPSGFTVKSLGWTSDKNGWSNWTIFEEPDYRGFSECLNGYGDSATKLFPRFLKVRSVGSISVGCNPTDSSLWSMDRNTVAKLQKRFSDLIKGVGDIASVFKYYWSRQFNAALQEVEQVESESL